MVIPIRNIFLLFLNNGDKKMHFMFCFSLTLISFKVWADPNNLKFFLILKELKIKSLLNDGIYAPSKFRLIANFILLLK